MAAHRKVVEISIGDADAAKLQLIARSRTEPASRVERARILLGCCDDPSLYAVGRAVGVTHQTVQRCLARATRFGAMAALDDSPRPAAGHVCLARIAQGTVCKILADQEVKPHKVHYYLERRDPRI